MTPSITTTLGSECRREEFYNIKLNHITTTFHTVTVLAPDGVTSVHEYWPEGRQVTGSYIPWIAPEIQ